MTPNPKNVSINKSTYCHKFIYMYIYSTITHNTMKINGLYYIIQRSYSLITVLLLSFISQTCEPASSCFRSLQGEAEAREKEKGPAWCISLKQCLTNMQKEAKEEYAAEMKKLKSTMNTPKKERKEKDERGRSKSRKPKKKQMRGSSSGASRGPKRNAKKDRFELGLLNLMGCCF